MCFQGLELSEKFIANTQAKAALAGFLTSGRMPHALLLEGAAGTGKKTFALYAASLFLNDDYQKGTYEKILAGNHPDFVWVKGDGSARSFHIDAIREIRDSAYILPNQSDRKIYLLSDCQSMSIPAQNALLKLLEEPPLHCVLILTVDSRKSLLETIFSRCESISLFPPSVSECAAYLETQGHSKKDAAYASGLYEGNIGQCLALLSDEKRRESCDLAFDLMESVATRRESAILIALSPLEKDRKLFLSCLQDISELFGYALRERYHSHTQQADTRIQKLNAVLSAKEILDIISCTKQISENLNQNANHTLALTQYGILLAGVFE